MRNIFFIAILSFFLQANDRAIAFSPSPATESAMASTTQMISLVSPSVDTGDDWWDGLWNEMENFFKKFWDSIFPGFWEEFED